MKEHFVNFRLERSFVARGEILHQPKIQSEFIECLYYFTRDAIFIMDL
jgi:hypothetical protein